MAFSGIRLKKAIRAKGCTQTVLAYRLGVDRSQITNWINGKYEPRDDMKGKIASILNVSEAWLAGYDVPMKNDNSTAASEELTQAEIKLLELFRLVPEDQQASFLELGRVYANSLKKD